MLCRKSQVSICVHNVYLYYFLRQDIVSLFTHECIQTLRIFARQFSPFVEKLSDDLGVVCNMSALDLSTYLTLPPGSDLDIGSIHELMCKSFNTTALQQELEQFAEKMSDPIVQVVILAMTATTEMMSMSNLSL